jgi:hypothetical protein
VTKFDCIVVISHGLELSSNRVNYSLAMTANNLQLGIPIICPHPIWITLEDLPCAIDCIPILGRDSRIHDTSLSEIIGEVTNICYERGWRSILLIACPEDQKICTSLLFAHGLQTTQVDYNSIN